MLGGQGQNQQVLDFLDEQKQAVGWLAPWAVHDAQDSLLAFVNSFS